MLTNGNVVGLERKLTMEIPHDDRTIDDPMWDAPELDWNVGWVALDNKEVAAKGIPTAMHWPWDDSKSIYVFHAFHSLHCVVCDPRLPILEQIC